MSDSSQALAPSYGNKAPKSWIRQVFFQQDEPMQTEEAVIGKSAGKLDLLAAANEDIRGRCTSILDRIDEMIALREDLHETFDEIDRVLQDTEATNMALAESKAVAMLEGKEYADLKARHRDLRELADKQADENCLLRNETQRFEELLETRETRIRTLERELRDLMERETLSASELEQAMSWGDSVNERLRLAEAELAADQETIAQLQSQISELTDRCTTSEFHVKALEASIAEARMEHDIAVELSHQRGKEAADEIADLKAQLDAQKSRAEAAESLLARSRAEVQAQADALHEKDGQIAELEGRLSPLDECLEQASGEIVSLNEKLAQNEKTRALLADGAQALVRTLSDEKAKLETANERALLLEQRCAAETARFGAESEELHEKIRDLTAQLERERSAYVIATSALEAARGRAGLQGDRLSTGAIFDQAAESIDDDSEFAVDPDQMSENRRSGVAMNRRAPKLQERGKRLLPKAQSFVMQGER